MPDHSRKIVKFTQIYYWSGTGNSYRIAHQCGDFSKEKGMDVNVRSIDHFDPENADLFDEITLLGIVFPTHGFTAPWHVIKSVWRLPQGRSKPVFCVATRAGLKFGKVFTPGISGSGTFLIALILMLKGHTIKGLMSVDMPSNWFSFHPIQSKKSHAAIILRAKKKSTDFMDKILSNQRIL